MRRRLTFTTLPTLGEFLLGHICARASHPIFLGPDQIWGRMVIKNDYPSQFMAWESFKNIKVGSKTVSFRNMSSFRVLSQGFVPSTIAKFWWFLGHKIWTQGPNRSNLVSNESSWWYMSYKTVCNNTIKSHKLVWGHKHDFWKGLN